MRQTGTGRAPGRWLPVVILVGGYLMPMDRAAAAPAAGPLSVSKDNPRYFADPTGRVVYLTGAHTWSNFKDMGPTDPPAPFDYDAYLAFLEARHHNFVRLWTWDLTRYNYTTETIHATPWPWLRTGPGDALDGRPKFDLSKLDDAYFARLRQRVEVAGQRGIYVSIMLFEGHGLHGSQPPWSWQGHPCHRANNVNGIDGDPDGDGRGWEVQSLTVPAVTAIQEAYVRRVVDTVNDLDNVLYEIVNESGAYSTAWQYHIIRLIHDHERPKPRQHPVGMTFQFCRDAAQRGTNQLLFDSPAEWISPNPAGGYRDDPPAADGRKVVINDTDHLWGIGGTPAWVWQSFCRGHQPIFMDPYLEPTDERRDFTDHLGVPRGTDPRWEPVRQALGQSRRVAEQVDLRGAVPHGELASTKYCLAAPGQWYVVFAPGAKPVTLDLTAARGELTVAWYPAVTGPSVAGPPITGGGPVVLSPPFAGEAVALVRRR